MRVPHPSRSVLAKGWAQARPRPRVRLVQVTEMLPQFAAQSTAMVCDDVPAEIGDWYRLLLVLWYSDKPVVTGAFSASSLHTLWRGRGVARSRNWPRGLRPQFVAFA